MGLADIKVFVDSAEPHKVREMVRSQSPVAVDGVTTNPTLMRRAGVTDYRKFGRDMLDAAEGRPVSFEVLADDPDVMQTQALELASWDREQVFVKVPVMTTSGQSTGPLISALDAVGVKVNVTAVFTVAQVSGVVKALGGSRDGPPVIVSVFAGRIADTGRSPERRVRYLRSVLRETCSRASLLWASPRQVRDIDLAVEAGCEIITMTPDLIAKVSLRGKDLDEFSRETVEMFYRDAQAARYDLSTVSG